MKNLQFPEQDYQQLCDLASQAGFRVSRGRGSQLRLFVMAAANNACTLTGGILPPEKPVSTSKRLTRSRTLSKPAPRK
mgnify:CR=1 FL=1